MRTEKVFLKKTKVGSIIKIVREHYLRDDISCESLHCTRCVKNRNKLELKPGLETQLFESHYLLINIDIIENQIDLLEDARIRNVIVLQSLLQEVRHRKAAIYKRVRDIIQAEDKSFIVFSNEFHRDTYVEQTAGQDRDSRLRALTVKATLWYNSHLLFSSERTPRVLLLVNTPNARDAMIADGVPSDLVFTVYDYVKCLSAPLDTELFDRLAAPPGPDEQDGHGRRGELYPSHEPLEKLMTGVRSGRLVQGTFRASAHNYLEAEVTTGFDDDDQANDAGGSVTYLVQGREHLNRAVDGDTVAIIALPHLARSTQLVAEEEVLTPDVLAADDDVEQTPALDDEDLKPAPPSGDDPAEERRPAARVVGIIRRRWRQYCGMLAPHPLPQSYFQHRDAQATHRLFIPSERKIPRIRIETQQAERLRGQRIVVAIDQWPAYSRYPIGHFVRALGAVGTKEAENEVLLLENDVPHGPFPRAVLDCLPSLPWTIDAADAAARTDLRTPDYCVCSVDPVGCTDIDDALHCRPLDSGNFEVGVHIADVSHFIGAGTALDAEAARRGTTVYLVDRRIDMVPELLSSNLCSLRANEDRFAFSIIWEMTPEANIVSTQFHKSIIKSKAALTYAEAQLIIDDASRRDVLARSLRQLNALAKRLNRRRTDAGINSRCLHTVQRKVAHAHRALSLASAEVRFHIDAVTHEPIDVQTKDSLETNSMVEEFMLLANVSAAERIYADFPHCAVLRRHPAPPVSNFEPLVNAAKTMGFEMCVNSGRELSESLNRAVIPDRRYFNTMLRLLATRCMMQAVYFSSGSVKSATDFTHYGLAAPIYTHFTSPIRRYSDVLVHRLLAASIGACRTSAALLDARATQAICNNLNWRHRMAQRAARDSVALHTKLLFRDRSCVEDAYVVRVRENALAVLVPRYRLEGTLYLRPSVRDVAGDSKPPEIFEFDKQACTQRVLTSTDGLTLRVFDRLTVRLSIDASDEQRQRLRIDLIRPVIPGFSLDDSSESRGDISNQPPTKRLKKQTTN